ncbi:hypothetical protein PN36_26225 [Candidatus Thiomargarita nelsonii]|uniref:AAA domain-containing protein n=1 Tax=Candidatus Thiomargarita nelsonii TaxID=1003181 RepID=A0A4E0QMR5_9GAMM|nr:hypothetical protein PN36_26225 [Candidatus Thiomargarita nelsonii]
MRRTGKTFFCYQKIQELLATGISITQMLYLNFEDDRLLGFTVHDFQSILDVYYSKYPAYRESRCHFFFDEIQSIAQWELFIRRLSFRFCRTGFATPSATFKTMTKITALCEI